MWRMSADYTHEKPHTHTFAYHHLNAYSNVFYSEILHSLFKLTNFIRLKSGTQWVFQVPFSVYSVFKLKPT